MPKTYYIDEDEWWPVYRIIDDPFHYVSSIELTDEQYLDYITTMDRFNHWQSRLKPKTTTPTQD